MLMLNGHGLAPVNDARTAIPMRADSSIHHVSHLLDRIAVGDGCWEWLGSRAGGYGQVTTAGHERKAHRASYRLFVGPIPAGMCVCHRCDNPGCVKPSHLFVGTHKDNARDRDAKGRAAHPIGEAAGSAKLTTGDVRTIRTLLSDGLMGKDLAAFYGVSEATISLVKHRKVWSWLG